MAAPAGTHCLGQATRQLTYNTWDPPLWQVEVQLHCRALPFAADGVLDLDIDLGPIEGTTPLIKLRQTGSSESSWVSHQLTPC